MRWAGPVISVVALVAVAGCAQESDVDVFVAAPANFAATPEFVADAADRSSAEAFRFEATMRMDMAVNGESLELEAPIISGVQDGDRAHLQMDFGGLFEAMGDQLGEDAPDGLLGEDMSMEMVVDGETVYMRSPFLASMAELAEGLDAGPADDLTDVFSDLGDRWARFDAGDLGDTLPDELSDAMGTSSSDPREFLEMLAGTTEVRDLGPSEIDGEPVTGLAAEISLGDLLEAQEIDPDDLGELGEIEGVDDVFEAVAGTTFPLEVWLDGEGLIRRIDFTFDLDALADAAEQAGEEVDLEETDEFAMGMTVDFFDYGDESIEIPIPSDDEVLDITDAFADLLDELTD